jgi:hypothetical protein
VAIEDRRQVSPASSIAVLAAVRDRKPEVGAQADPAIRTIGGALVAEDPFE